ncbi:MAG TPA: hypothetical protein VF791_05045 [Pyrinomonadaceae bacterium]
MQKWVIKHFIISGILAAITFALAFALGAGIILATGVPATGGIANIFVAVLVLVIGVKIVPKFGFAILTIALVFTFAIPTIIGGPPGIYKILNGLLIGLVVDIILVLGRRTRWAHILAGSFGSMISILSIYVALVILQLPGASKLAPLLLPLTAMQAVLGALAAWIGLQIFERRLSKLGSVQRLMASPTQQQEV